jgi:NAD(P)-dependent dehydrogenase (short-subunit alcohol dehydrogenase family)
VWAAVRTEEDEQRLRREHDGVVTVLRMDLTDLDSVRAAGERVRAAGALHGLVNNAGVAVPGPLEYLPIEQFRHQLEVNLIGQLAVTQEMLPALRQAKDQGADARIVMVGSMGGRIAGPMLGAYHTSKFGMIGLTDTLRAELAPSGIPVILVEPGIVATPLWNRRTAAADALVSQLSVSDRERYAAQIAWSRAQAAHAAVHGRPPKNTAQVIVKALTAPRPRPRYLVGADAHAVAMVARLPFRLRYWVAATATKH